MPKKVEEMNEDVKQIDSKADTPKKLETKAKAAKAIATTADKTKALTDKASKAEEKATAKAKKTTAKKAAKGEKKSAPEEIYLQYAGQEILLEAVLERAKAAYVAEGHRLSGIKTIQIYIKPEENAAYYVINGKPEGKMVPLI